MNRRWVLVLLAATATTRAAEAQAPHPLTGLYGGVEIGPVSYDTQINFDGVDDPAGRGGTLYSAVLGYASVLDNWLLGMEGAVTGASLPDPYTFDPAVTGFAELDLRRGTGVGLRAKAGRLIADRLLVFGSAGYAVASQSVRLDGIPLGEFGGASDAETFGTVEWGAGVEWALSSRLGLRFAFRSLGGHDLSAADFGSVVPDAGLTFFDVEPRQKHFVFGTTIGF